MDEARDLLIEIGTEELPPTALKRLSDAFLKGFRDQLTQHRLSFADVEPFSTPRRLALLVQVYHHLPQKQLQRPPVQQFALLHIDRTQQHRRQPLLDPGRGFPQTRAQGLQKRAEQQKAGMVAKLVPRARGNLQKVRVLAIGGAHNHRLRLLESTMPRQTLTVFIGLIASSRGIGLERSQR